MSIYEHATHFANKPVADWEPDQGIEDPTGTIYRISLSYEEGEEGKLWTDKLSAFLDDPASSQVPGIVVGVWGELAPLADSGPVVEALVAAHQRLPNLKAIFLGDIISEEHEISWIQQTDISPLLAAYPQLEHLCVRGTQGLSLGSLRLPRLKELIIQSGGLPSDIVRQITAAHLPELEHLELWLGIDNYGGDTTLDDLMPILSGKLFPKLTYLGLRDSEMADEIAQAVARAPIIERLRVLDLSMGTLGDEGAAALLESPSVAKLEMLDLHHHFCSEKTIKRLEGLGIKVDASEPQTPDSYDGESYRYVAVSE